MGRGKWSEHCSWQLNGKMLFSLGLVLVNVLLLFPIKTVKMSYCISLLLLGGRIHFHHSVAIFLEQPWLCWAVLSSFMQGEV